jgi:hypothetical protein
MWGELSASPSAWRRRSGNGPAPARTNTVKAAVVNAWAVRPTLERIVACSSGRLVCCRLIKPPSLDPTPPAASVIGPTELAFKSRLPLNE